MTGRHRVRAIALRRERQPAPFLPWLLLAAILVAAAAAAHGQTLRPPDSPSVNQPAPAPPPAGARPDTPGGSSSNGVVRPPATAGDPGMPVHVPPPATSGRGVIAPPGTPGGNPNVVPK